VSQNLVDASQSLVDASQNLVDASQNLVDVLGNLSPEWNKVCFLMPFGTNDYLRRKFGVP